MRKPITTLLWRNWFFGAGYLPGQGVIVAFGPLSFLFKPQN